MVYGGVPAANAQGRSKCSEIEWQCRAREGDVVVGGRLGAVAAMRARYWYTGVDVVPLAEVDCTVDLKLQQQCRRRGLRWCGKSSKLWWERLRRDGLGWGAVQCSAAHRQAALCLAFVAAPRLHFTSTSTTRQYQPTTTPSPASPSTRFLLREQLDLHYRPVDSVSATFCRINSDEPPPFESVTPHPCRLP